MERKKREAQMKGVTLVSLVVTIIVLLIIASITVYGGKETIKRAQLEELRTNMLLIQAKAKEYVEEANFKIGLTTESAKIEEIRNEVYVTEANLVLATSEAGITTSGVMYQFEGEETLKKWGLEKIKDWENYLIEFKDDEAKVEIYHKKGFDGKKSLTEIDNIQL